ncbi:hypothetical protein D9758_013682 [Tetrapyrgos nigripes]|uniref:F-box domain-containing protein n=1 Tax=Tetrapyrgos nigripes TaxID=182062 RepID=A0A8H5FMU8_9AGAR|nr:hypothetical protein D9758_013682 [Tetrapyrgos nigripes]
MLEALKGVHSEVPDVEDVEKKLQWTRLLIADEVVLLLDVDAAAITAKLFFRKILQTLRNFHFLLTFWYIATYLEPVIMPIPEKFDVLALRGNYGTYTSDIYHVLESLKDAEELEKTGSTKTRSKQKILHQQIHELRSLLAPIRRIPPDVRGLIFSLSCVKSEMGDNIDCPTVRLSQVCAGWRELARTTPSLWSSFSLSDGPPEKLQKGLDLYLELSVDLDFDVVPPVWRSSHVGDWDSVKGKLPILRSLRLNICCMVGVTLDAFQIAPMLQEVSIQSFHPLLSPLPFGQLTRLTFSSMMLRKCFDCLQLATAVLHDLPSLTALRITSLPLYAAYCSVYPKDTISKFFARSQCSLASLILDSIRIAEAAKLIITLLQALPFLSSLTILEHGLVDVGNSILTEQFFNCMTVNHPDIQSAILPHLKKVDFQIHTHSFPTLSFLGMIRSRSIPDHLSANRADCLKSVTVHPLGGRQQLEMDLYM